MHMKTTMAQSPELSITREDAADKGATSSASGFPTSYRVGDVLIEPNVVLAPMEGVTDVVFRRLIRSLGGPGLTYTEFIASQGIVTGEERVWNMASFDPDERPVALQIYGREPAVMAEAARILEGSGATIIDINMGCPSKKVCKNSGGSGLMREPELAISIVRAVRRAISIPLTVKMRSGFDHTMRNAPELARAFEQEGAQGITIHWRTRADLYGGERAVDKIAESVDAVDIPVIANGDIIDIPSARRMFEETGCAGVMLGRGAIRDPWSLLKIGQWLRGEEVIEVDATERERVLTLYYDRIEEHIEDPTRVAGRMKMIVRHFADGVPHSKAMRKFLCRGQSCQEVRDRTRTYFDLFRAHEQGDATAFHAWLETLDV